MQKQFREFALTFIVLVILAACIIYLYGDREVLTINGTEENGTVQMVANTSNNDLRISGTIRYIHSYEENTSNNDVHAAMVETATNVSQFWKDYQGAPNQAPNETWNSTNQTNGTQFNGV